MSLSLVLLTLLATTGPTPVSARHAPDADVTIKVDSARHEVVITAGPWHLMNMPPMANHAMMDMGAAHDTPLMRFAWPVEGWFRGFKLEVRDGNGTLLPRHIMHHLVAVNTDRRQLLYQAAERLFGAGTETDDASIPATIGVPLHQGMGLGFYIAWHNDTGVDLDGVHLTITMQYSPSNLNPRPVDVMPIYMDVNLTVGGTNTYDVAPGRSQKVYDFQVPLGGRLLAYGGHMHDYGVMVRLEDAATGKELARITSTRDAQGKVTRVSRSLPGVRGEGLRMKANHPYRVVAVYDNPTGEVLKNGAMASIVGLFAPDNLHQWPAIELENPIYQVDLASLEMLGSGSEDHDHMDMDGSAPHEHN
ncbi:MAG: hypothetical protein ABI587_06310 [Gemmatimonadales bacterium]